MQCARCHEKRDVVTSEIHIDNDDDAREDITFQFDFDNDSPGAALDIGGESVAVTLKTLGAIGSSDTSGFA